MALPKISVSAITETKAVHDTINGIKDFQSKGWGIGLNGDTFQPDGFLSFFAQRGLAFSFFVVNSGVSIGTSSAYGANIDTLQHYLSSFQGNEKAQCQSVLSDLQSYKAKFWAIGLNGDTFQPDGFNQFFAERGLPFFPFLRSKGVSIGDQSAYDKNITALQSYISGF
jgi:hypothetical protein